MVSISLPHSSEESGSPHFLRMQHHKRVEAGYLFTSAHIRASYAFSVAQKLLVPAEKRVEIAFGVAVGWPTDRHLARQLCCCKNCGGYVVWSTDAADRTEEEYRILVLISRDRIEAKMPDQEWIKTLEDGRKVKFIYQQLPQDGAFMTAQLAGNEVVYSVVLTEARNPLSRKDVENRFKGELSKK